MYSISTNFY